MKTRARYGISHTICKRFCCASVSFGRIEIIISFMGVSSCLLQGTSTGFMVILYLTPSLWRISSLILTEHYNDVIMGAMASQITSLLIVYSTVCSRRRSKKTSKLRVAGLCAGNSPVTGEFPPQMVCNAENISIWWRHHGISHESYLFTM